MELKSEYELPRWAPRLTKEQIRKLYTACGKGILDAELIDDAGFSLYARCESMLEVDKAVFGKPICPKCETAVEKKGAEPSMLICPVCAWKCPEKIYHKTYKHKNLSPGGMKGFITVFVGKFKKTHSHAERLVLIDTLIHQFHWASGSGRPAAVNFIEGTMKDIMPFLDSLSYGDKIPADIKQKRAEWRKLWQNNPWSRGRGQ